MKYCNVEGCNSPVWGKGYCRYHQYLRSDIKRKIKVKVEPAYVRACRIVDADPNKSWCVFCGRPILGAADHHHTEGREGENLCNTAKLYRAHRRCHDEYHHLSVAALLDTFWYRSFLLRIKTQLPEVYKREVKRLEKSGLKIPTGVLCLFLCLKVSIMYSYLVYL